MGPTAQGADAPWAPAAARSLAAVGLLRQGLFTATGRTHNGHAHANAGPTPSRGRVIVHLFKLVLTNFPRHLIGDLVAYSFSFFDLNRMSEVQLFRTQRGMPPL